MTIIDGWLLIILAVSLVLLESSSTALILLPILQELACGYGPKYPKLTLDVRIKIGLQFSKV